MKWMAFRVRTKSEAEDIIISSMQDIGLYGAQIEDHVPLTAAEKAQAPVMIQCSEGAAKYMGGFKVVADMVKDLHDAMGITVPVALHLDHGTFDGAGHTITINMQRSSDYAGLFYNVRGNIQDLTVNGTIHTSAKFAGGIAGNLSGGQLLRCQSYVDIISSVNGDGTHGGIIGINSESDEIADITDCLFGGSIQGGNTDCCGGVCGWASAPIMIANTLVAGDFGVGTNGSDIICRNSSMLLQDNCHYYSIWNANVPAGVRRAEELDLKDGTICYLLNGSRKENEMAWYQTLAADPYPVPDSRHLPVYRWQDGTFSNDDETKINEELRAKNEEFASAVYDLSGRKLVNGSELENNSSLFTLHSSFKKGIYIINGKKIVRY